MRTRYVCADVMLLAVLYTTLSSLRAPWRVGQTDPHMQLLFRCRIRIDPVVLQNNRWQRYLLGHCR